MRRHVFIAAAIALLILLAVSLPASASADPLLSGYGGPGQGNQLILGATLLGGEGSGPSGGSGEGTTAAAGASGQPAAGTPSGSSSSSGRAGSTGARKGGAPVHVRVHGKAAPSAAGGAAAEGLAGVSTPALGLNTGDLLIALGVLAALVLTALLTRRLVDASGAKGPAARPRRGT